MSYILDALKKSEQERARGEIPDIKSLREDEIITGNKKHHVWFYIAAVALIINFGAVYMFWIQDKSSGSASLAENGASSNSSDPIPMSNPQYLSPTPLADDQIIELETAKNTKPVYKPHQSSVDDKAQGISKSRAQSNESTAQSLETVKKPKNVVFAKEPLSVTAKELKQAKAPANSGQPAAQGNVTYSKTEAISNVSDLPAHVREQIPNISFEGHVYSSVSKQRSVMINGQKMREGQNINSELTLEQITIDGAVFLFRGHQFKLGALQDWNAK